MNKNKNSQMSKFLGLSTTLSLVSGFVSPLVSGTILDYASYIIIFALLTLISLVCFVLSLHINIVKTDNIKYGLGKFIKQSHKNKGIRTGYLAQLFFNLSNDGVVTEFLPILIFLKTGTNFSVGIFSAVASVLSGIILLVYCYFNKNKKVAMLICCFLQVAVSLSILIWSSLVVFFVYYFIKKIVVKILRNGTKSSVFCIINNTELEEYKVDNFCVFNFYNHGGILIASFVSLLVYNLMNNVVAITVVLAIFSLTQIVSTILLNKSDAIKAKEMQIVLENKEN